MNKVKASSLRQKTDAELAQHIEDLKKELSTSLRVAQVTGMYQNKVAKMKVARKNLARVLTVQHQRRIAEAREAYKGKKYIPLNLRPKKTRAIRRALTKRQREMPTVKLQKRLHNLPRRNYALLAP